MKQRVESTFPEYARELFYRLQNKGVLCTVTNEAGERNVLTLGWGLIGRQHEGNPMFAIAVTPLRYSWSFLEQVPEFVIGVPDDALDEATVICGTRSGRELDKFAAAGLTPAPSLHVRPPSLIECPINIECRVYTRVAPPHMLLSPAHRQRPLAQ